MLKINMAYKYESKITVEKEGRGGCLDALVTFVSFGTLGIKTQVISETRILTEDFKYEERLWALDEPEVVSITGSGEKGTRLRFSQRTKSNIIKTPQPRPYK